jgi:hypothetical protein
MDTSSRWSETESWGTRQRIPVEDKEGDTSSTTAPAELEYAIRRKNTMHTLGYSSGSAQLWEAVQQVEVAALYIKGNRCQGRLPIPHLLAHLLQPLPC